MTLGHWLIVGYAVIPAIWLIAVLVDEAFRSEVVSEALELLDEIRRLAREVRGGP